VPLSTSSEPIPVKYAQRQGLRCVLHSPQPLEPGSSVRQDIDFQTRWDHMQQHTGQHLLSAIMDAYDNLETLGWGMGSNGSMSYVDLPRKPTDEELQTIQEKCNKAISNNHAITVETPDDAEKNNLPSDYDKELGVVRVINIKDIDRNTYVPPLSHPHILLFRDSNECPRKGAAARTSLKHPTFPSSYYITRNPSTASTHGSTSAVASAPSDSPGTQSPDCALWRNSLHVVVNRRKLWLLWVRITMRLLS
jgi:hypothetical protein